MHSSIIIFKWKNTSWAVHQLRDSPCCGLLSHVDMPSSNLPHSHTSKFQADHSRECGPIRVYPSSLGYSQLVQITPLNLPLVSRCVCECVCVCVCEHIRACLEKGLFKVNTFNNDE